MKLFTALITAILIIASCITRGDADQTKRKQTIAIKYESEIKLPIKNNFITYSYFNTDSSEFFSYLNNNWIYLINLSNHKITDSINILFDSGQIDKYGNISSFCFNGKDSVFLLLNRAVFFVKKKTLLKIIPINELDTLQYKGMRFANLENAPIFYDKITDEIVGQVYCSTCTQIASTFYTQQIIGHISFSSNKLQLYDISFSNKYIENYYGFANKVYVDSQDTSTLVSFPCDERTFLLNREKNQTKGFWGKSLYQTVDAMALPLSAGSSREEKMRHLTTVPYYAEIRYDKFKKHYYRFFLKNIPIRNKEGKYNSFTDKGLTLIVFNSQKEVIGEYELTKYYNNYISFVGKSGLYINFFSNNPANSDGKVFKILTFD